MQIHEITKTNLDEGLLDLAKKTAGAVGRGVAAVGRGTSAVAKPFGAVKGAYQAGAGTNAISLIAKKASIAWNQYAETLKAATPDPARYATLYTQALEAFVQKNLLSGHAINTAINQREIRQIIDQISAASANPQQVTQLFPKLVQQAAASQQNINTDTARVVSTNPPLINYKNIDYAQNSNGDWANQRTSRVPDESFQAFLDQEFAKAGV